MMLLLESTNNYRMIRVNYFYKCRFAGSLETHVTRGAAAAVADGVAESHATVCSIVFSISFLSK